MQDLDVLILADSPHARTRLLGLTLVERGRRVATRVGARRVLVLDGAHALAELRGWADGLGQASLLVIRAGDQVVHRPLVEPLLRGTGDRRIAVGPDGSYAGAFWVAPAHAREVIDALAAASQGDAELVARWPGALMILHILRADPGRDPVAGCRHASVPQCCQRSRQRWRMPTSGMHA